MAVAAQFRRLVRLVAERGGDAIADGRPGRQWSLDLSDRVLLVAAYWRTNLTMHQIGPLFGVSHSAAHRVIDTLGPLLALAPVRRRRVDQIAIVDGTLIPTRDHRLAAPSKNYRYSTNLQVAIDAHTRLVVALGDPQPGNRNDTIVYRTSGIDQKLAGRPVMADGAYRGNPEVIIPYRKPADGSELPEWKDDLSRQHRTVRAQVEHALARMKCFKILRDYRRAAHTLTDAASGIVLNAAAAADLLAVISQARPQPGHHEPLPPAADRPPTQARVPRQTARGDAPPTPRRTTGQRLHLQILGDTMLQCHGRPVTIRRTAARQALVFLAVHPDGANSRDLTTAIWPGLPAHTVTSRLYTTLSDLRKAVAAVSEIPLIEHTGDRYRLRRDHIEVDLWRFHAAVEHAATAVTARPAAWQAVINAYTGNLAAGHDWPWLNPPREALRRRVIDAYTALAATQPDPRRALSLLQDAIRVDPYNEDLHRRAIHALEVLGDHAAAEDLLTTFNRRLTDAGLEHEEEVRQPRAASSGQTH